jgi:uncharacterized lipoprotein YddW (UPF0748 family)
MRILRTTGAAVMVAIAAVALALSGGCRLGRVAPGGDVTLERPEAWAALDKRDPKGGEFPGGRGADELVLYTPAYGEGTGTNAWGLEATVVRGVVRKCEGNNSEIPRDGFVISGHGAKMVWIRENLRPGTEVEIREGRIVARFTLLSKIFEIEQRLKGAEQREQDYEVARKEGRQKDLEVMATRGMEAIAGTRETLKEAETLLRGSNRDEARKALARAERASKVALYSWEPSVTPEGRGVWFRVGAKSPEEVRTLVERVERSGMNLLFPETIYWGMTLCPQLWEDAPKQHPQFAGWDPLEDLIREAHGRGLEVHAWCEIFFMGPEGHSPLAQKHPDWVARDRRGGREAKLEENFHFFCPARPDGREFILKNLVELVRKYELDGLQLDYIRYPRSVPFENGFCYCDYCREKFRAEEGADPLELTPEGTPELWEKWNRWREKQVSSFVAEASRRLHEARPGLVLSAAVFPEFEDEGRRQIFQNWKEWSDAGWVDLLCPMIYRADTKEMARLTEMDLRLAGKTPLFAGLAPFMKLSEEQLVEQIRVARELGAQGQVLFSEEAMTQEMRAALREGPYRNAAAVPRF